MIDQIALGLLGGSAVLFSQSHDKKKRALSPILGLAAQPFWFYSTFVNEQWAIFALSFFYTYAWWKGLQLHWGERIAKAFGI